MAKPPQQGNEIPKSNPEDLSISDGTLFDPNNPGEPIPIQKYGMDYNNHLPKSTQANKNQTLRPGPSISRPKNEEPPWGSINFFCCRGNFFLEKRRNSWPVTGQTVNPKISTIFAGQKFYNQAWNFVSLCRLLIELEFWGLSI